jgi:hypothetical protein
VHNLNIANLEDWVCKMLRKARSDTTAAVLDIRDILAQYFAENNRNIIRVNDSQDAVIDPELEDCG